MKSSLLYYYVNNQDDDYSSWTHVKEIPGSKLLISLHHFSKKCANIEVFNLTKKGKSEKIYSFDEVIGCKFVSFKSFEQILFLLPSHSILVS